MCEIIVINKQIKIQTPLEFKRIFQVYPILDDSYNELDKNSCLCQCSIDKTLNDIGIKYEYISGDGWYINDLVFKQQDLL